MDPRHKAAIQNHYPSLVAQTDLNVMLSSLYEKGVFAEHMIEQYKNPHTSDTNHKRNLYLHLMRRGPNAFRHLIDTLWENGLWGLARELDPEGEFHGRPRTTVERSSNNDESSFISISSKKKEKAKSEAKTKNVTASPPPPPPVPPPPPAMPESSEPPFVVKKCTEPIVDEGNAPFWLLHLGLTFHTYTIGTFMYNKFYAKDVVDYVNSFLNISVLLLISNAGCWTLFKRSSFQEALSMVKKNDDLVKESERFSSEHASRLRFIKMLVLANFGFHFVNDVLIFSTARIIDVNDIIVSACAGLNPLSGTLNMAVCKAALTLQEFTAIIVVGTYDAALIFLVTHTTAMCDILRLDIASIREISAESSHYRDEVISNRLKNSIYRHSKILQTVKKLQHIYEIFIGVDFSNYAMSLLVFFVLPLDICLKFGPLVSHNLLVFFLYCLLGQRLTTAAERIEIAIYDCGWENFTKKDRITVLFMLKQSQKPVVLFAAKVVPICIYTFAYAMQTIYKFVTVFKV